jgi:hypothetical protein
MTHTTLYLCNLSSYLVLLDNGPGEAETGRKPTVHSLGLYPSKKQLLF